MELKDVDGILNTTMSTTTMDDSNIETITLNIKFVLTMKENGILHFA